MVTQFVEFGDAAGHIFHGNQWTDSMPGELHQWDGKSIPKDVNPDKPGRQLHVFHFTEEEAARQIRRGGFDPMHKSEHGSLLGRGGYGSLRTPSGSETQAELIDTARESNAEAHQYEEPQQVMEQLALEVTVNNPLLLHGADFNLGEELAPQIAANLGISAEALQQETLARRGDQSMALSAVVTAKGYDSILWHAGRDNPDPLLGDQVVVFDKSQVTVLESRVVASAAVDPNFHLMSVPDFLAQFAITAAGDLPGHDFHGNQWTGSGVGSTTKGADAWVAGAEGVRDAVRTAYRDIQEHKKVSGDAGALAHAIQRAGPWNHELNRGLAVSTAELKELTSSGSIHLEPAGFAEDTEGAASWGIGQGEHTVQFDLAPNSGGHALDLSKVGTDLGQADEGEIIVAGEFPVAGTHVDDNGVTHIQLGDKAWFSWGSDPGMNFAAAQSLTFTWNEDDHPRDANGKFGDSGGDARVGATQRISKFISPAGDPMTRSQIGDTMEALIATHPEISAALQARFGGNITPLVGKLAGASRQNPLDLIIGNHGAELKSVHIESGTQATTMKRVESMQKTAQAESMGLKPLQLGVVWQPGESSNTAHVYAKEGFVPGRFATQFEHLGSFPVSHEQFANAFDRGKGITAASDVDDSVVTPVTQGDTVTDQLDWRVPHE